MSGAAEDIGQVARLGMADGDGGVGVHQEKGHGFADDVTTAEDDGVGPFDLDFVAAQDFHAAGGGAGDQAGTSADEATEIDGMETVHVFGRINGFENTLGINLRRERELDEDSVDVVGTIQVFDDSEQVESSRGGKRSNKRTGETELLAGCNFTFYIKLRGGVLADKNGCEAGANTGRGKQAYFIAQLGEDLVPDFEAVEDARGHAVLAFALGCGAKENHNTRKNEEAQVMVWEPSGLRI